VVGDSAPAPVSGTHTVSVTRHRRATSYDGATCAHGADDLACMPTHLRLRNAVADVSAYAVNLSAQSYRPDQTLPIAKRRAAP